MYNTIASLIHFSLVNNIEKVTYNDNNQSDGTLIHEINGLCHLYIINNVHFQFD